MRQQRVSGVLAAICFWAAMSVTALGDVIAFDNGDPLDSDPRPEFTNTAYFDGWDPGDNGGYGFLPWDDGLFYGNPIEIDSGPAESDNQVGTPAFRLGTGGFGYWAERPFASPMAAGQSFMLDFDQFPYSFVEPVPVGYFSNDSLMRWTSAAGERFALYNWNAKYNDGTNPVTDFGSADEWGISAASAFDNLNGGAALPTGGAGLMTGYTGPDSTDGFSVSLDIITIDTYRLRIVDDNVLKVDVSGDLRGGATAGQGIDSIIFWSGDATGATIDTAYFTNLQILDTPAPPGVAGDYNDDGTVDAADYVLWRKLRPTGGTLANDDTPGADDGDYDRWVEHFGEGAPGGGGNSPVPEPASMVLIILGAALVARPRRSR